MQQFAENDNLVAKIGAPEEWFVEDKYKYALEGVKAFGFQKIMAESNYLVNVARGDDYWMAFEMLEKACEELGATQEQKDNVFFKNCENFYGISYL